MIINFDHNASTYPLITDLDWIPEGNPNSLHPMGVEAAQRIKLTEKLIQDTLGEGNIIWTSSGTEANYLAITGIENIIYPIITSSIEHSSILYLLDKFPMVELPVSSDGFILSESLRTYLSGNLGLISKKMKILLSIMSSNNETGAIQPVPKIVKFFKDILKDKLIVHVDMCQSIGKHDISSFIEVADMISVSGHKLHSMKGTGFLWTKKDLEISYPRRGTLNVHGIFSLYHALDRSDHVEYRKNTSEGLELLISILKKNLQKYFDSRDITYFWKNNERYLPNTLMLTFNGIDGEEFLLELGTNGVCVSQGSACNSKENKPSHVLLAMGFTEREALSSIRISIDISTDRTEIMEGAQIISDTYLQMRSSK